MEVLPTLESPMISTFLEPGAGGFEDIVLINDKLYYINQEKFNH